MSPALYRQMLTVLSRDDNLRRAYVRRRWQGLVEEVETASPPAPMQEGGDDQTEVAQEPAAEPPPELEAANDNPPLPAAKPATGTD